MHDDVFKNPVHTIPPFLFFSSTFFPSSPTAGRYCYYYTTLTNKFKPAGFSKRPEKGHNMKLIKTLIFISSLAAIPALVFILVLCMLFDMVRQQQLYEEEGDNS